MKGGPGRRGGRGGLGDGPSLPADWAWKGGSYQEAAQVWNAPVIIPFRAAFNRAASGGGSPPPRSRSARSRRPRRSLFGGFGGAGATVK